MQINDAVVVVTGAASGIGEALAHRFAREDVSVVVAIDRDGDGAQRVAEAVDGVAFELDVADDGATVEVFDSIDKQFGRVDIVCLNAGIATGGSVDEPNEVWERAWQVNVMSHVYATRCVLPGMLERGRGYLVHTASAAGLLTNIGAAPYSVTKHGVVALAEWLSVTYGDRGIGVSALCPQFVDTPMLEVFGADSDEMRTWVHSIAVSPDQVAESVIEGIIEERFLILPHPEVADYFRNKAADHDRWISGMRRLQASME